MELLSKALALVLVSVRRSTSEGMAYDSNLVIIPLLAKKVAQKLEAADSHKE